MKAFVTSAAFNPGAAEAFEDFHQGEAPAGVMEFEGWKIPARVVEIGRLEAVQYRTTKAGEVSSYLHKFKDPPLLCTDGAGHLFVAEAVPINFRGIGG